MRRVGDHPVTFAHRAHLTPHRSNGADIRVPERQRLAEPAECRFQYRADAIGAQPLEQQTNPFGLLPRLADESGPAELQQHTFGARREQRAPGADEHLMRAWLATWQFQQLDGTALQVLYDLPDRLRQTVLPREAARGASPVGRSRWRQAVIPIT